MIKLPSAVVGTMAGGAIIFAGLEVIAASSEGQTNVEQVNACAKHLGNYAVGAIPQQVAKQEAEAVRMDCKRFEPTWTPVSVNYTKQGTQVLVTALPDLAGFFAVETPPAKVVDRRNEEIKLAKTITVGIVGTLGGVAVYSALNASKFRFRRRKSASTPKTS